ncbi:hypothetical protein BH23THE1_BH23THE1_13360 [soil metagenome]
MESSDYQEHLRHGTIVLLDVLGTKNMSEKDRAMFVLKINELIDELDVIKNDVFNIMPMFSSNIDKLQTIIQDAENYYGDKTEDSERLNKLGYEMEYEVFSDTILILIHINDFEFQRDDLMLYFTSLVIGTFLRSMLIKTGFLVRGAMSVGDYYFKMRNNRLIINGISLEEVAACYERTDWGGIITSPTATNIIRQQNTVKGFQAQLEQYESSELSTVQLELLNTLKNLVRGLTGIGNYLVKYDIPWKNQLKCEGYAVGWPLIEDEHSKEIEKKLNELLIKYESYKNTDKHDIYMKYKTQLYSMNISKVLIKNFWT